MGISITSEFKKEGYFFVGDLRIDHAGVSLDFNVSIPHNYPLTHPNADNISIIFVNKQLIGYEHINGDGSVCFHPKKDHQFDRKFKAEIKGLKNWIFKYYVTNSEDDRYTYLLHPAERGQIRTLYFTNTDEQYVKNEFGEFIYSKTNENIRYSQVDKEIPVKSYFRISTKKGCYDNWAPQFSITSLKGNKKIGVWCYIKEEPIQKNSDSRRRIALTWKDLEPYLPPNFIKYIYDGLKSKFNKNYFTDGELFILIGYKIPNEGGYEDHWDLVTINKKNIPIETKRIPVSERTSDGGKYMAIIKKQQVNWCWTENIDRSRFFGRGMLPDQLVNAQILIIGCGAIGSKIAEMLVRGGVKSVILEDFDSVSMGNLCRSTYFAQHSNISKPQALKEFLQSISPFVSVNEITVKLNLFNPETLGPILNENVDYIFDCSTDPEVSYILDHIDYKGTVYSMGVTNKAKSFVCVTGEKITLQSQHLFETLENDPPTFFEGTGCGYPTFEASGNDIATLTNLALKKIITSIENNYSLNSFVISTMFEPSFQCSIKEFNQFKLKGESNYLYIPKEIVLKMENELRRHYPKEFGGVFIGQSHNDAIVIEDILIPDDYDNGDAHFTRHPGSLNEQLQIINKKSSGRTVYIGEWHSHPDQEGTPSKTDKTALKEIASDKKIQVDTPILIIAEISSKKFNIKPYIQIDNKLIPYE